MTFGSKIHPSQTHTCVSLTILLVRVMFVAHLHNL